MSTRKRFLSLVDQPPAFSLGRSLDAASEPITHSALSAIIGSTRLARRAGIQRRKAIVRSAKAIPVKVIGSEALTP